MDSLNYKRHLRKIEELEKKRKKVDWVVRCKNWWKLRKNNGCMIYDFFFRHIKTYIISLIKVVAIQDGIELTTWERA
jgi:hypothetical protein